MTMTTTKKQIEDIVNDAPDLGKRVQLLNEMQEAVQTLTADAVADCRAVGITWNEIGKAFGITRQAALHKWGATSPARPTLL